MRLVLRGTLALLLAVLVAAAPGPVGADEDAAFPTTGILPKRETGALRFLEAHPQYDGRGVVVAIFDTGVDPGAPGLQTTTDGKPKIVDLVDASGSGDVDTSEVVEADDGRIEGLTGRTLILDPAWKNPSGRWHVGAKRGYELFPSGLTDRLRTERTRRMEEGHRALVARLDQRLETARKADDDERVTDLEAQRKVLVSLWDEHEDPGPIFDCVVFHDGTHWRGVVDADGDGDLAEHKAMATFRVAREWSTFGEEDLFNYALNIHDGGDRLSIVCDVGAHGTHVAGIVAAHDPQDPSRNGLAPGVQIVGVKIGDARTDSSSLNTGEVRGIIAALRNDCDLVNMSYGGASAHPDQGRMARLLSELVDEHGTIFVASAGNDGPALGTVGSPGGTTSSLFGIGAWLTPDMMRAQTGVRRPVSARHYTWSSQGPTLDGALGVDFSAPGGAIAPVPNWSLQGHMEMAGTSMAAPNACGAIALLVSGLKAEGRPVDPERMRRALVATARPLPGISPWATGHGLIQVDRAWAHLEAWEAQADEAVRIDVAVRELDGARGIVLREPWQTAKAQDLRVRLSPHTPRRRSSRERLAFEMPVSLTATQPWVEVASHAVLTQGGATVQVRVDPLGVPGPGAHFAWVDVKDSRHGDRPPVARIPVTVIRPEALVDTGRPRFHAEVDCTERLIHRHFLAVPPGATWADVRVRAAPDQGDKLVVLQTLQQAAGASFAKRFQEWYVRLSGDEVEGYAVPVEGGRLLEVVVAQYWSSLEGGRFTLDVDFHGIVPEDRTLTLDGNAPWSPVILHAPFADEELAPRLELDTLRTTWRPSDAEIRPLSRRRDGLPRERRVHEMVLTYEVELDDDAEVRLGGTLAQGEALWDEYGSTLWQLFDDEYRLVRTGTLDGSRFDLEGGTWTVRVHLRHEDRAALERYEDTLLTLDEELHDPFTLPFHATALAALTHGETFEDGRLPAGSSRALFVRHIDWGDLPAHAYAGDVLLGTVTFGLADGLEAGSGRRPGGFPVRYLVPPDPPDYGDDDNDEVESLEGEDAEDAFAAAEEALAAAGLSQVRRLRGDDQPDAAWRLAQRLLVGAGDPLPLRVELMRIAWGEGPAFQAPQAERVRETIAAVLAGIDTQDLARRLGTRNADDDEDGEPDEDPEATSRREALTEALQKRIRMNVEGSAAQQREAAEDLEALARWVDLGEDPWRALVFRQARARGQLGKALALVSEAFEEDPRDLGLRRRRMELLERLGWEAWAAHERAWLFLASPPDYPLF